MDLRNVTNLTRAAGGGVGGALSSAGTYIGGRAADAIGGAILGDPVNSPGTARAREYQSQFTQPVELAQPIGSSSTQPVSGGQLQGGGGGGAAALTRNAYGQLRQGFQGLLDRAAPQKQAQEANINQMRGQTIGQLDISKGQGLRGVGDARDQLGRKRNYGLKDIANNTRNVMQSFGNTLGSLGASDSSASELGQIAIADQSNEAISLFNRGIVDQTQLLNTAERNVEDEYNKQKIGIDQFYNQQLSGIQQQYDALINSINQQMTQANFEEQQALAGLAGSISSGAQQQYQALQNSYDNDISSLGNNIQQYNGNVGINSYLPQSFGYSGGFQPTIRQDGQSVGDYLLGQTPYGRRDER